MKEKKIALCVAMLAGLVQAADVSCEWAATDMPETLAEGKVAIRYDGSGSIQSLTASPTAGDTIILTGDEMPFAADAKIQIATEGRLEISNAVTCAGDLSVTGCAAVITRSWNDGVASTLDDPTQALLPTNSFRLMFENMDLDEWEPVEFRGDIPANIGSGWYFPNHFKAEYFKRRTVDGEKQMFVDLKATGGSSGDSKNPWTKGVRIVLRQNGLNVEGKAIDSWYGNRLYEGMCIEEASLERNTPLNPYAYIVVPGSPNGGKGGYGVSQLTMKRVNAKSECCLAGAVSMAEENRVSVAGDVHLEGRIGGVTSPTPAASPAATPNFHVDGTLTLFGGVATNSHLRGNISGGGTVIVEGRDEIAKIVDNSKVPLDQEYVSDNYIRSDSATVRNTHYRQLHTLTNATAIFWGKEAYTWKPSAKLYHLSKVQAASDYYYRIGQFQGKCNGYLYCVYVRFSVGADNHIKSMAVKSGSVFEAYKVTDSDPYYEGMDFDQIKSQLSDNRIKVVNSYDGEGISIRAPRFYFSVPRSGILSNKGFDNEMTGSPRFVVRGSSVRSQVYEAGYVKSLPSCGRIIIERGGELYMPTNGVYTSKPMGYNDGGSAIHVNDGGRFVMGGKNSIALDQRVVVDGGEFVVYPINSYQYGSGTYVQRIVLKNGGRVSGVALMMGIRGHEEQYPYIKVCGDSPSEMDVQLTIQGQSGNDSRLFDWRIADVTENDNPDFVMNGDIRYFYYGTGDNLLTTNVTMRKYGDGTILANGRQGQAGVTEIYKGEIRLGASGIGYGTYDDVKIYNVYTLCGGRLGAADGTSNKLGDLRVEGNTANSAIVLGDGAKLEFADSSSNSWTGSGLINIDHEGELGKGVLRFGTTKYGLTATQLARLRHNGGRVVLTDEGWCIDRPKTFRIIVR